MRRAGTHSSPYSIFTFTLFPDISRMAWISGWEPGFRIGTQDRNIPIHYSVAHYCCDRKQSGQGCRSCPAAFDYDVEQPRGLSQCVDATTRRRDSALEWQEGHLWR